MIEQQALEMQRLLLDGVALLSEHREGGPTVFDVEQGRHVASCEACWETWPCPASLWRTEAAVAAGVSL